MIKKILIGLILLSCAISHAGETRITQALSDNVRISDGMAVIATHDPILDLLRDKVEEESGVNIRGLAPSGCQTTISDIWDRADSSATQQTWIAPTVARLHNIASSLAADDGDPVGTGTHTIKLFGLTDWDGGEANETITMNGTSNVSTALSYVIINTMEVITWGTSTSGPNEGTITATAVTDSTISSVILPGEGRSHSSIYGIPSISTAYIKQWWASINKASAAASHINFSLRTNEYCDNELTNFVNEDIRGLQSTGLSSDTWPFNPYLKIDGPAIIKVSGIANAADVEASAGYDLVKVTDIAGLTALMTENGRILTDEHGRVLIIE